LAVFSSSFLLKTNRNKTTGFPCHHDWTAIKEDSGAGVSDFENEYAKERQERNRCTQDWDFVGGMNGVEDGYR
jgi:hypothetical protein